MVDRWVRVTVGAFACIWMVVSASPASGAQRAHSPAHFQQDGESYESEGEDGDPGTAGVSMSGGDGSPGPPGRPGRIITPAPPPPAAPVMRPPATSSPTAPPATAPPESPAARPAADVAQRTRSNLVVPVSIGLVAALGLALWTWRRGPAR